MIDEIVCVTDVETANDTKDALTYDVSCRFINPAKGIVVDERAYVVRDVFVDEHDLMKQAYYASKMPEYSADIRAGKRQMIDFMDMRQNFLGLMKKYDCHIVAAYNAAFDTNALNTTLRYLTKSKYRWFFPYGTQFVCIWNMACSTICQTSNYKSFAELNRYYSNHGKNYRATAETVYAYLTQNPNFNEEHKGMEDVRIECEIMKECLNINDTMMSINRGCWNKVKRGALCLAQ